MSKLPDMPQASSAGFHFANLYQCCQRKFFIRWVVRPISKFQSPALTFGSAFHEGKAVFYKTQDDVKAKEAAAHEVARFEHLFEYKDAFQTALRRVPILLSYWINTFGYNDLVKYNLVEVENEYRMSLPGNPEFTFTGRIDAVVEDKATKKVYILETKTAGASVDLTLDGVWYGDQATSYLWLARNKLKREVEGVIADVAYWHKNAKYETNIQCVRSPEIITRSGQDIHAFVNGITQIFTEIAQKVEAYKAGIDETILFPRNTFYCCSYGKPCEFATICKMKLSPNDDAPFGFQKDGRKHELGGYIEDQIAES